MDTLRCRLKPKPIVACHAAKQQRENVVGKARDKQESHGVAAAYGINWPAAQKRQLPVEYGWGIIRPKIGL
jgi:hypothetical protein